MTIVLPRSPEVHLWDARSAGPDAPQRERDPEDEPRARIRQHVIVFVLSVIVVSGLVAALFGERGFLDVRRSHTELHELRREVKREFRRVRALKAEVKALQDDPAALERFAREELGFGREGEIQLLLPRSEP